MTGREEKHLRHTLTGREEKHLRHILIEFAILGGAVLITLLAEKIVALFH